MPVSWPAAKVITRSSPGSALPGCSSSKTASTLKYRQLGAPEFQPHCLFIGRFRIQQRLDLLLETFHRLVQRAPDARLTIVGRDWDGNLARMNAAIDTLGLAERVEIAAGLSDEQIKEKVTRHCVSASDYEGFGMTLVEGMAAGLIPSRRQSPVSGGSSKPRESVCWSISTRRNRSRADS